MRATVVVDNKPTSGLTGEWGLCIYIEYEGKNILLDAGASDLFVKNAERLGLRLEDVDAAVLSHAHYDHANGMEAFFRRNDHAKFYLRAGSAPNCYFRRWPIRRYIGIPKTILVDFPDRIVPVEGTVELFSGVWLLPHSTPQLDAVGRREHMYLRTPNGWTADDFSHEQSLIFDTDKGLVIFNSCSHGGAVNIINEAAAAFPEKHVHALIGGFHLYNKPLAEVRALGEKIRATGIEYVCTGHCTAEKPYAVLKQTLGDTLHQLQTGLVMEF